MVCVSRSHRPRKSEEITLGETGLLGGIPTQERSLHKSQRRIVVLHHIPNSIAGGNKARVLATHCPAQRDDIEGSHIKPAVL